MAAVPESGFLLLADITGYLARGEVEHAPTIADDLLETVIGRLEPPFRLAKLERLAATPSSSSESSLKEASA